MTGSPRKGRKVSFEQDGATQGADPWDQVSALRFTIDPPYGGGVLVDFTTLRPRGLALAFARGLFSLVAPRGPIIVRTTVKAYTNTLPRFFAYLATTTDRIDGPADLRARHIDGFEAWLEAAGKSRVHLPTVVAKIVAVDADTVRAMIDDRLVVAHRARALSPERPVLRGTAQNPDVFFQSRERANPFYDAFPALVQQAMDRFGELTGRRYRLFDYVGAPDAERVIVVMGSAALKDPEFVKGAARDFPGGIVVAVDARDGFVATDGWAEKSDMEVIDLARRFEDAGVASLLFTDVGRDGLLKGCNVQATVDLARATDIPVIASGGVAGIAAAQGQVGAAVGKDAGAEEGGHRDGPDRRLAGLPVVQTTVSRADRLGAGGAGQEPITLSERFACVDCGVSLPPIEPRMFSFNGPHGACKVCDGIGSRTRVDPEREWAPKSRASKVGPRPPFPPRTRPIPRLGRSR